MYIWQATGVYDTWVSYSIEYVLSNFIYDLEMFDPNY